MAGIATVLDQQGTSPKLSCQTLHSRGLFSASLAASTAADLLAAATPASTALFGTEREKEDKMLRVSCCMRSVEEWFPSHNQLIVDIDEEGRKIFEAFYGRSLKSNGFKYDAQCMNFMNLTDVIGATDDDDTRTLAEFAVDQYNKNKKENEPPLRFVRVVKAIKVRPSSLFMVFYLITLQALGESTDPNKFFARVSVSLAPYDGRKLDDWMPVDDDLTQFKHCVYKLRKEKKLFLREMAAHLEKDKRMFFGNIADKLKSLVQSKEERERIWKAISVELEREMQFKEQDWFTFEEEDAFRSLHKQDQVCASSENQAELHGATSTESPPSWWITASKADLQYSSADL
ncbi:hypothetical protein ACSBR1_027485 [Camellia fascicularis]